ncbi:MAG: GspH/FimT family pseudopilin [Novosphingobium sp.]|nr:GspH/FimT family pseudopilin [Novosphingobium sp.]
MSRPRQALRNGFSLIELMVVLFVIGLLASVVVLSLPDEGRALRDEAERFAARTVAARDAAISGARPVAVVVGRAGYYFEQRRDGRWQPLEPGRFGLVGWKPGTSASVVGGAGEAVAGAAPERQRVVFDPVGLASSEARVRLAHGSRALVVSVARDGTVKLDAG